MPDVICNCYGNNHSRIILDLKIVFLLKFFFCLSFLWKDSNYASLVHN